jgi:hypothetical protein
MRLPGREQPSDPIVAIWDAALSGQAQPALGHAADPETFAFIQSFHGLDDAPMPDIAFLNRLEADLIGSAATQQTPTGRDLPLRGRRASSWRPIARRRQRESDRTPLPIGRYSGWVAAQAALAVILLIAAAGFGAIYLSGRSESPPPGDNPALIAMAPETREAMSASPPAAASPAGSPAIAQEFGHALVEFMVDPSQIAIGQPENWNRVKLDIGNVAPGVVIDTSQAPYYCCRSGLTAIYVIQGSMDIQVPGASFVIREGQNPAAPETHEPSTHITLSAGATIWYRNDAGAQLSSAIDEPLRVLNLSVQENLDGWAYSATPPDGYTTTAFLLSNEDPPLDPGVVSTAFRRLDLEPGAQSTLTVAENQRLVMLIDEGGIQYHKDTGDRTPPPSLIYSRGAGYGIAFHTFSPGDYIVENTRDQPAVAYLLSMTTALEAESSAAPAAPDETIAAFLADPAALAIGDPGTWNLYQFELAELAPGNQFDASLTDLTCCGESLAAIHVLEGSMRMTLSGPAGVLRSDSDGATDVLDAAGSVDLGPGDTIWYAIEEQAMVANTGEGRLKFLTLSATHNPTSSIGQGQYDRPPEGYEAKSDSVSVKGDVLASGPVSTGIRRIEIQPGNSWTLAVPEVEIVMAILDDGFIQYYRDTGEGPPRPSLVHSRGPGAGVPFHEFMPGDYLIENRRDKPAIIYLLSMATAPAAGQSATPAAGPVAEPLLDVVIDPALVGAEPERSWQVLALTRVALAPEKEFVFTAATWQTALESFLVSEGSLSVESGTPSQVIRAGATEPALVEARTVVDLEAGDTWLAGIGASIRVANAGEDEAELLLFHYGVDRSLFGFGAGTIAQYPADFRPVGMHAEDVDPMQFEGPVAFSVERVAIEAGQTFSAVVGEGEMVIMFNEDGRMIQMAREGSASPPAQGWGFALHHYGPGTYTFSHTYGDAPLLLYFGRASPADSG